jgi:outer membrane protein assembly factor BamB/HEAT repeat protein
LIATPFVSDERIYLAAVRDTGLQPTGAVHCLDRRTLKPIWTFDDGGRMLHMFSSPVVSNGRLYVGEGMHANFECHLYCLDAATGQKVWTYAAGSHIESTPVFVGETVIFGAGDDGVVCVRAASGERIWKLDRPAHVDTTPVIADGIVYAGSGTSRRNGAEPAVFALDAATGRVLWRVAMDLPVWASPTLSNGVLFVGLGNGRLLEGPRAPEAPAGALVALDAATGNERWRFRGCDAIFGQPAVDSHRVYVGSRDCRCYAVDRATGRPVWSVECGSAVVAGPVWAGSILIVTASDGHVIGLDPATGMVRWQFDLARHTQTRPQVLTPPAIHSSGEARARKLLYLPTELRTRAGSAATLFVFEPRESCMRKRFLLISVVVVGALILVALFEPTGVIRGYARGEPFFEGRPASTWGKRLVDENPKSKEEARRSLRNGGKEATPILAAIVESRSSDWGTIPVRVTAIDLLGDLGPAAAGSISALIDALADRDRTVRTHAAEALGSVGPESPQAVAALLTQLNTPDALPATKSLAKCGSAALPATRALVALLKNADPELRWNAINTLGRIHAIDALDPLIAALQDPADLVREHAAEALGDFGPAAATAVEPLIATLKDPYFKARRDAARSLGQIGPAAKSAIPALQSLAKDDPEAIVRKAAETAVKKLGG